jgi:hypothetical protein
MKEREKEKEKEKQKEKESKEHQQTSGQKNVHFCKNKRGGGVKSRH